MVVHEPGDWFEETLEALAAQDYPNLRTLFLVTPTEDVDEQVERIRAVLPDAFIRELPDNAGFGPSANEVLRLVEGDNGFFLLCHDDIAPAPDAVRALVAEIYRSNAGIVGPKLTEWDQPRVLQHVGLGLDRYGEVDPIVEPGEVDQEQHDAVRDVFVLPSACMLVRADLFRTLGGFDPAISFHGDDVDLCWRAHLTGARVIVVPDARVRHLERLTERRPDLNHTALQARHRMRAVATLTGASRLLPRSIELVVLTLVELVVGLFTGRITPALASLRALVGLIPRSAAIVARRRAIRGQRMVPEREVLGLQDRGSSRLNSYLRGKETTTFVGADATVRRWREASFGPVLAWFLVLLGIAIGSRTFIRHGVPPVGEFLPFPESPSALLADFRDSFDNRSFGVTAAVPTGWAVLAITSVLALFRMGLFLTMTVVGCYVLGAIGAWRLSTVFPVNRARIAGMVVYVATPLVPGLLGSGDWSALAWYAALPWMVHLLRSTAGLAAADPAADATDLPDGVAEVGIRHRVRSIAYLSLVLAVTAAFVPVVVVLWAIAGLLLALATLLALSSWRVAAWFLAGTVVSIAVALVLNLPWALDWTWAELTGAQPAGASGADITDVATMAPSTMRFSILALALYLPVLAALAITRAWRFTWSVRAAALVVGFGTLAVLADRAALPVSTPDTSLLLVPVALGLALGGAAIADGLGADVLGRGFGWRQPVALLANVALVIGLVPAVLSIGNGAWDAPRTPMSVLLATQLQADPTVGDHRVLYLGDPRLLPVPGREYQPGIAWAVVDVGDLDFTDRFPVPSSGGDAAVEHALDLISTGSTLRAGHLLAPLGIRFVVVPLTDGVVSTVDDPLPLPEGMLAALSNQLDLGSVHGPPALDIFLNESWFPVGAQLTGPTAEASRLAGDDALIRADLTHAQPALIGVDDHLDVVQPGVQPGVVHVGIPFDGRLTLDVGGTPIAPRPGFGVSTAFDIDEAVAAGGAATATLQYERDGTRSWWLAAQTVLWVAVLAVAAGARSPFGRRRGPAVHDETLIDLSDEPSLAPGIAGEVLGTPAWGYGFGPFDVDEPEDDPDDVPGEGADAADGGGGGADAATDPGAGPADADPTPPEPAPRPSRPLAPLPDGSTPLPTGHRPGAEPAPVEDDEVDLAALVAQVDAQADDDEDVDDEEERS